MINVGTNWNVAQVKQAILHQSGLQPYQFKLVFAGQELKDNMTLEVSHHRLLLCAQSRKPARPFFVAGL